MDDSLAGAAAAREAAPRSDGWSRAETVFVWTCLAVLCSASVAYCVGYGSRVPFLDEFAYVERATGEAPLTPGWLWSQGNEHRFPLPRLLFTGAYAATGCDARSMTLANVVWLGGLSALLLRVVRRLRGRTRWTDAAIPFALLHPGHCGALLWGMTFTYVFATVLGAGLLLAMTRTGARPSAAAVWLVGLLLLAMVLSGANGLVFAPATFLWLGYVGVVRWRTGGPAGRSAARAAVAVVVLVSAVGGLYFVGYQPLTYTATDAAGGGLGVAVKASLAFLASAFGPAGRALWPYAGVAAGAVLAGTTVAVAVRFLRDRSGRGPALAGALCYLLGFATLAAAVGWGRRGYGVEGVLDNHYYSTMAAPLLFGTYFAWQVAGRGRLARGAQVALFALATAALAGNAPWAVEFGRWERARKAALEADVRAGLPVSQVSARHHQAVAFFHEDTCSAMEVMRRHRIGVFGQLRDDPPFRRESIPVSPTRVHEGRWEGGTFHAAGRDSYLVFALPRREFVRGVEVRIRHRNDAGMSPYLQFFWRDSSREEFAPARRYTHFVLPTHPDPAVMPVWVYATADEIKIQPDTRACEFTVESVTVITAEGDPSP
ncbi:MAG: hypothetical protein C0501_06830 [Isosphaera sp.]|nr:hypothetical protein [Isosphaera sp.]